MNLFQAIILGIVQGITEFLPISSSGHLALLPEVFGWKEHSTYFDVVLHGGTLAAILIYFRLDLLKIFKDLFSDNKKRGAINLLINICISTLPALAAGYLFQDFIDEKLKSLWVIAAALISVAVLMIIIERMTKENSSNIGSITKKSALIIGVAQTLALIRGVSRSGITMLTSMSLGITRQEAARYSFLISIPILAITFLYALYGIIKEPNSNESVMNISVGFISSFLSGYLTISFLLNYIKKHSLEVFAYYRILLGLLIIVLLII